MRDSLELIREMGVTIEQIRVSGGGARNPLWRQIQADIYGHDVHTVNSTEGPAFGVALLAIPVGGGVRQRARGLRRHDPPGRAVCPGSPGSGLLRPGLHPLPQALPRPPRVVRRNGRAGGRVGTGEEPHVVPTSRSDPRPAIRPTERARPTPAPVPAGPPATPPRAAFWTRARLALAVGLLLTVHLVLAVSSLVQENPTIDEVIHLPAGISYWQTGTFKLYHHNPPLVKLVAALPVLAAGVNTAPLYQSIYWRQEPPNKTGFAHRFAFENAEDYFTLFTRARLVMPLFSVLGGLVVFAWSRRLYGGPGGLLSLALWVACPNILAHARLITTDLAAAAFAVLAQFVFWLYLQRPSGRRAAWAGLVLGLAQLTKFSLILLYGLWPLLAIIHLWIGRDRGSLLRRTANGAGQGALILALSLLVIDVGYCFEGVGRPLGRYEFVSRMLTPCDVGHARPTRPAHQSIDNLGVLPKITHQPLPIDVPRVPAFPAPGALPARLRRPEVGSGGCPPLRHERETQGTPRGRRDPGLPGLPRWRPELQELVVLLSLRHRLQGAGGDAGPGRTVAGGHGGVAAGARLVVRRADAALVSSARPGGDQSLHEHQPGPPLPSCQSSPSFSSQRES